VSDAQSALDAHESTIKDLSLKLEALEETAKRRGRIRGFLPQKLVKRIVFYTGKSGNKVFKILILFPSKTRFYTYGVSRLS
jgi:hypothetical protein